MLAREIVLDTETTGLDPSSGHRIVEIGAIELINFVQTGKHLQYYINPQRDMPGEAFRVHGLSQEFLSDKPIFSQIADSFLSFIGQDRLIIHNAEFDMRFINSEITRLGYAPISMDRVVDTLALARRKHPGASNSLDALCLRYRIDNNRRLKHGALLDSEILAEIYIELIGGRQAALSLVQMETERGKKQPKLSNVQRSGPLKSYVSEAEKLAHLEFIEDLGPQALWKRYI